MEVLGLWTPSGGCLSVDREPRGCSRRARPGQAGSACKHTAAPAFCSQTTSRWANVLLFFWKVWEVGGDIFGCYFHSSFLVTVGGLEGSKSLPVTASIAYQPCPPPGR